MTLRGPDFDVAGGAPIHVMSYDAEALEEHDPASMPAAHALVGRREVTWINVDAVDDPAVLASLEREFGIHPLTVEDIQHTHQRPKIEEYDGYLYVVMQMVREDSEGEIAPEQVSLLLGDGWLITVQDRPGDVFDGVRQRIRGGRPRLRRGGSDHLLYALVDAIVDAFFPILESLGDRTEELEERILSEPQLDRRGELHAMRRSLLTLRRLAWPQRDAMTALERTENPRVREETRTFLRDVSDHATRVIDFVEVGRELLSSLMELHMATVAQRTNDTMRVLTVMATIFIPLTFVAGIYGMNFERMPELRWRWGYPAILASMTLVAAAMLVAFRRRGWL